MINMSTKETNEEQKIRIPSRDTSIVSGPSRSQQIYTPPGALEEAKQIEMGSFSAERSPKATSDSQAEIKTKITTNQVKKAKKTEEELKEQEKIHKRQIQSYVRLQTTINAIVFCICVAAFIKFMDSPIAMVALAISAYLTSQVFRACCKLWRRGLANQEEYELFCIAMDHSHCLTRFVYKTSGMSLIGTLFCIYVVYNSSYPDIVKMRGEILHQLYVNFAVLTFVTQIPYTYLYCRIDEVDEAMNFFRVKIFGSEDDDDDDYF